MYETISQTGRVPCPPFPRKVWAIFCLVKQTTSHQINSNRNLHVSAMGCVPTAGQPPHDTVAVCTIRCPFSFLNVETHAFSTCQMHSNAFNTMFSNIYSVLALVFLWRLEFLPRYEFFYKHAKYSITWTPLCMKLEELEKDTFCRLWHISAGFFKNIFN